ncbi:hypothetical protein RFI_13978 [Reticulomyxa filosa]|uniref:adenosine deaminase n=1 Tax=Reticulomyxa filosa TaxID=46433 RepID=X6NBQ0_RETFI|nr:hypothetical protein RFI_13978 [Reticulomyxa filosa]|eukprot:ETO23209.1 hypothetical protein RFI_13978 [Reticulomyxa filosa]
MKEETMKEYPLIRQGHNGVTPEQVLECVLKGITRGERDFGVMVRPIIQCIRHRPDLSTDSARLAFDYREEGLLVKDKGFCGGVVGIDLFGCDELLWHSRHHVAAFVSKTKHLQLKKSVHCGDSFNERGIGFHHSIHGLLPQRISCPVGCKMPKHILHRLFGRQTHLEICFTSNLRQFQFYSLPSQDNDQQPMFTHSKLFAKEFVTWLVLNGANFSFSTDFPVLFDISYQSELQVMMEYCHLTSFEVAQIMFEAVRNSFLPTQKKLALLHELRVLWKEVPGTNIQQSHFFPHFVDRTWSNQDLLGLDDPSLRAIYE